MDTILVEDVDHSGLAVERYGIGVSGEEEIENCLDSTAVMKIPPAVNF